MLLKGLFTAATAVAMLTAPTVAAAQSSAARSVAAEPVSERVEGSELAGGFIIPLLALLAVIVGILAATGELGGDDDVRTSP